MQFSNLIKTAYILSAIILSGCENNNINTKNPIPESPVNYSLNIMRDAPSLDIQGNSIAITDIYDYNQRIGYSGLLIVHGLDDAFYAFDLCCPHEHKRDVKVEPSMIIARCPVCGTVYDIGFGTGYPNSGPSEYPLKRYTVTTSGYNLRITR